MKRTTKQNLLQWIVDNWSKFCFERQHQRQQFTVADNFYNEYLKCLAMVQWQEKWSQAILMRQKELTVTRQMNVRRLTKGFSNWYGNFLHKSRIRSKKAKAIQFHTKSLQTKLFRLWKSYHEAVRYQASKRKHVARLQQQKLLARLFRGWYRLSEASGVQRRMIYKAETHRAKFVMNRVFQHWERYRSKRTLHIIAYTCRRRFHLRKAWLGWKQHRQYAAMVRQNILVTTHLIHSNLFRSTLERWKSYVVHRREGQTALNRAEDHYTLWMCKRGVAVLRKWREYVSGLVDQRVKTAKAVAFRRANLRSKAWQSWLRYIAYCFDKQKQLEWVLSYYSVEVLLRRSLTSWKELIETRQVQRKRQEVADSFNTHRLLCEQYRQWREYVTARRIKQERFETLLHTAKTLALSRAIKKWRKRAVELLQYRRSEAAADQFHSKRRRNFGLNKLIQWRTLQKIDRGLMAQAKCFRGSTVQLACFRRWQRYHHWRVKYTHLTLIFKRNQKEDIFTRWKLYWKKRQSSNDKRLKARIFHCVQTEQKMLRLWRTFVLLRKQKKGTISFNTAKILRRTFNYWRHRAHVLRKMKKMLASQESFRALTYFDAWKRFVVTIKMKAEKLRKAMKFKNNLQKFGVWHMWRDFVLAQKQERLIIDLAVGFRLRFSNRKTFAVWRARAGNWKRQRKLTSQAQLHYQTSLLSQGFQLLAGYMHSRRRLVQLQSALSNQLIEKRKRRAISRLRDLCAERERKRGLIKCACRHWQLYHQEKYWGCILQWFKAAQLRKQQRIQAEFFARTHLLQRYIVALKNHICHSKQLKAKVDAFRCRFFRSVADDCFYKWRSFTAFKLKLKTIRRKSLQSQRHQRLHQWLRIAKEKARLREEIQQLAVRRHHRELLHCFNHWESVCTDQWIDQQLIAHHQRHAQKQRRLRFGIKTLKSQLPARHERLKRKSFFLEHHRPFLVQVLQRWKLASVDQRNHFNM
ncbi:hypothetical protein P3T76_010070 [Phytophthora citrophthora]|uniref:Sfi1 spindle body domain-containing protein n=1 Tax=Phytophthora citrophthora TaxID=4793 RepID=A0AAD9LHK8_9STRA|nr:hypothetical protein P3T76_010070 [Phytophthora citrophthora]